MSILRDIFKRHQRSDEEWAAVLDDHLRIGAGYLEQFFNPATTAHIVVDVQKGYCEPCLPLYRLIEDQKQFHYRTEKTLNKLTEFSAAFDRAHISQFWLRHTARFTTEKLGKWIENYHPATHNAKLAAFLENANDLCLPVDPDRVIDKRLHNGFEGTALNDRLQAANIKTVLISGGMRRACVQKTAEGAANRHFLTFIVDDLTIADTSLFTTAERGKYADELSTYNIYPVTSDQVRKIMGHAP